MKIRLTIHFEITNITMNDYFDGSELLYEIERIIKKSNKMFNDGTRIIYVNGTL